MRADKPEKFKWIESNFDVEAIQYEGIHLWPFFRCDLYFKYDQRRNEEQKMIFKLLNKIKSVPIHLRSLLHTKLQLFNIQEPVIMFRFDGEYREIEGKIIRQNTQIIEKYVNVQVHIQQNVKFAGKKYVDNMIDFLLIYDFCNYILKRKYKIKKENIVNYQIVEQILEIMDVEYDFVDAVNYYLASMAFYSKWFRKVKPKALIVECYYDLKMPALYVAKKLQIPVIEFQHGMVNKTHTAYYSYKNITDNPCPDYFLCFGEKYRTEISNGYIFDPQKIVCVGYYYLSLIKKRRQKNKQFFLSRYPKLGNKIVVVVPSQIDLDLELFDFSKRLAATADDFFVIFVPRMKMHYHNGSGTDNFYVDNKLDVYQLMQNANVTLGVSTTCIIESLFLGTPSVMIDIKGNARSVYGEFLLGLRSIFFTDDLQETICKIREMAVIDRGEVLSEGKIFYTDLHEERIKKFFGGFDF